MENLLGPFLRQMLQHATNLTFLWSDCLAITHRFCCMCFGLASGSQMPDVALRPTSTKPRLVIWFTLNNLLQSSQRSSGAVVFPQQAWAWHAACDDSFQIRVLFMVVYSVGHAIICSESQTL